MLTVASAQRLQARYTCAWVVDASTAGAVMANEPLGIEVMRAALTALGLDVSASPPDVVRDLYERLKHLMESNEKPERPGGK
jgi:hypothetical protein